MKKFYALLGLFLLFTPSTAEAFETPLLTWERGRDQQVVLGGGDETSDWQVQLEGNGITPIRFEKSSKNDAGYVVYSASIPNVIPTGAYTVVTIGSGSPRTTVAVVAMVQATTKTATSSLFDLTQLIALFAFLTTLLGTLRLAKYSHLNSFSTQLADPESPQVSVSLVQRLQDSPVKIRLQFLSQLRPSVFKYLLLQEGEFFYSKVRYLYSLLPVLGLILGTITAFEIMRNDGIVRTGLGIFIAVTLLSMVDPISGLAAATAFATSELVAGNLSSVRDLLVVAAICFSWVAPALVGALTRQVAVIDLSKLKLGSKPIQIISSIIASMVGTLVFYLGLQLISSILYVESNFQKISTGHIACVSVALLLRSFFGSQWELTTLQQSRSDFYIARVNSPLTALISNFVIFSFVYIWTQSAQKSLIVSALFAAPYYLFFIGMGSNRFTHLNRVPRNFFIEAILVSAICWLVFREIASQPLLSSDASFWLLFLTSIPLLLHAQITAIWPNPREQGRMAA